MTNYQLIRVSANYSPNTYRNFKTLAEAVLAMPKGYTLHRAYDFMRDGETIRYCKFEKQGIKTRYDIVITTK